MFFDYFGTWIEMERTVLERIHHDPDEASCHASISEAEHCYPLKIRYCRQFNRGLAAAIGRGDHLAAAIGRGDHLAAAIGCGDHLAEE